MKGIRLSTASQTRLTRKVPLSGDGWRVKERKNERSIELTSRRSVPILRSKSASLYAQTMAASGWASDGTSPGRSCRPVGRVARESRKGQPRQNRRRLGRAACVIAVMSTAVAVLTMAGPLWQWFGFGDASRSGIAEAHLSSGPVSDRAESAKESSREPFDGNPPAQREVIHGYGTTAAPHPVEVAARQSRSVVGEQRQATVSADGYQLFLGAYRKEIGARYVWAGFRADLGPLLDNLAPQFERIQNENGTAYRILAGTLSSLDDADSLCARLRERYVACTIVRR